MARHPSEQAEADGLYFPSNTSYLLPGDVVVKQGKWILKTVVGSCVAVCLWDQQKRVGGMNHFLLPAVLNNKPTLKTAARYGEEAMEALLKGMHDMGAQNEQMIAAIIGGAHTLVASNRVPYETIGEKNAHIAKQWLLDRSFRIRINDVGGFESRRIHFNVQSGRISIFK